MPLLDAHGRVVPQRWRRIGEDESLPASGAIILTLASLPSAPACEGRELGVELGAGAELAPVLPWLDRLALVIVPFPSFRDGRGFTAARALRERHAFSGDIRAVGHLLPDQYMALLRVGVTTVELADGADLAPWIEALRLNQPASLEEPALPWLRRTVLPFGAA